MSQTEATMFLCQVPQVYTNIDFVHMSTAVFQERPGFERPVNPELFKNTKRTSMEPTVQDLYDLDVHQVSFSHAVHDDKDNGLGGELPEYRQFTETSLLL